MATNDKGFPDAVGILMFSILLVLLLVGCNSREYSYDEKIATGAHNNKPNLDGDAFRSTYNDYHSLNEYHIFESNTYNEEFHGDFIDNSLEGYPFFGIWLLDRVAISRNHIGEIDRDIYSDMPDVKDFLGQEMEFSDDFVRLGEKRFSNPDYFNRLWTEEWIFYDHEIIWTPGYWGTPSELLNYFRDQGIHVGIESAFYDTTLFNRVFIEYPHYAQMRWMGTLLDPELYMYNIAFNPLFQSVIVLNDDFILIGLNCLVLAKRIH